MNAIRILLVDDHLIMRQGLRHLLKDQADILVIGEAENGQDAVEQAVKQRPGVVVMDINMPRLNGVDATRRIVDAGLGTKVLCLTAHPNEKIAADVLAAGASGYVLKDAAFEELVTAIRAVMKDRVYISPSLAGNLVTDLVRSQQGSRRSGSGALSSREREILQLIAEGRSTKQAAMVLSISVKTVETHRRNLMEKLNTDSIPELTKFAVREGLTSL